MPPEPKDQRVPVMMTASELRAIDDWSFEQRIRSRGEAIRRLIQHGLEVRATMAQTDEQTPQRDGPSKVERTSQVEPPKKAGGTR